MKTKRNKKETTEKLVFWSIIGIYGALFLYGLFHVLSNFGEQSFNF
jgi:hypothetical protein